MRGCIRVVRWIWIKNLHECGCKWEIMLIMLLLLLLHLAFMAYLWWWRLQSHCVDWSFDVCDGSLVEGLWPSVHIFVTIWYHMHFYDDAFHDMWHCICMDFLVMDVCDFNDMKWGFCCCLVYVLLFIPFIMDCKYSPFCWYFPYHGKWASTQE